MKDERILRKTLIARSVLGAAIVIMSLWAMVGGGGKLAYANGDGHTHFRYGHIS